MIMMLALATSNGLSYCCTAPEHVVGILEDHQPSVFEDDVGGECIYVHDIVYDMEWYTTSYYHHQSIINTSIH